MTNGQDSTSTTTTNLKFVPNGEADLLIQDLMDSLCLVFIVDKQIVIQEQLMRHNVDSFLKYFVKALNHLEI